MNHVQVERAVIHSACALRTSTNTSTVKSRESSDVPNILILSPNIDCHRVANAKCHHLFLDTDLVGENRYCM